MQQMTEHFDHRTIYYHHAAGILVW